MAYKLAYHSAGKRLTTLAAEMLKTIEEFLAIYATSKCWMSSVSGGAQYVTEDVTMFAFAIGEMLYMS